MKAKITQQPGVGFTLTHPLSSVLGRSSPVSAAAGCRQQDQFLMFITCWKLPVMKNHGASSWAAADEDNNGEE